MRKLFEEWVVKQFGKNAKLLLDYDKEDGYTDQDINSMWIGFNAGVELGPALKH